MGDSAREAAKEPGVWVPLTGAALIAIAGTDDNLSDWAVDHQPLFGNRRAASDGSDRMLAVLTAGAVLSSVAVPNASGVNRWQLATRSVVIIGANHETTAILKGWAGRTRPDGRNDRSMPSRHSSDAFTSAAIIAGNLEYYDWSERSRAGVKAGAVTLAAATGWARIESGVHYPCDVLVGAALGNFMAGFLTRLMPMDSDRLSVRVEPLARGAVVNASYRVGAR